MVWFVCCLFWLFSHYKPSLHRQLLQTTSENRKLRGRQLEKSTGAIINAFLWPWIVLWQPLNTHCTCFQQFFKLLHSYRMTPTSVECWWIAHRLSYLIHILHWVLLKFLRTNTCLVYKHYAHLAFDTLTVILTLAQGLNNSGKQTCVI